MGFVSFFKIIQGTSIDPHFQICSQISPFLNIYKFDHGTMATSNIPRLTVHWYLKVTPKHPPPPPPPQKKKKKKKKKKGLG